MCISLQVVLTFLLYEGSTIHNASDRFVSCVFFFFVDFALHQFPTDESLICTRQLRTPLHPLKIEHMFI